MREISGDIKRESEEEAEENSVVTAEDIPEGDSNEDENGDDVDWEAFNKVRILIKCLNY